MEQEKDTRSNILAVATVLFATKGFAGVSIRELAKESNANVSAISYYFTSKEGLYQAVLSEQLSLILEMLERVKTAPELSPLQRLSLYAEQVTKVHAQRPLLSRFMHSEVINPTEFGGPVIEQHLSRVYRFILEALQEGVAWGDFRADLNVNYAAISLAGILNFYFLSKPILQKFIPVELQDDAQYGAHAFQLYLQGIMTPEVLTPQSRGSVFE